MEGICLFAMEDLFSLVNMYIFCGVCPESSLSLIFCSPPAEYWPFSLIDLHLQMFNVCLCLTFVVISWISLVVCMQVEATLSLMYKLILHDILMPPHLCCLRYSINMQLCLLLKWDILTKKSVKWSRNQYFILKKM